MRISSQPAKPVRKCRPKSRDVPAGNTEERVRLAAQYLPRRKAVGPDEFPEEFYKYRPVLQDIIACLLNRMLARNQIPDILRRFYVVPLDKAG